MIAEIAPNRIEGRPQAVAGLQGEEVREVTVTAAVPQKIFASIGQREDVTGLRPLSKAKTRTPSATKTVFLTGHPLMIVDASGRNDADKPVKALLSGLGWSVAKGESSQSAGKDANHDPLPGNHGYGREGFGAYAFASDAIDGQQ